MKNLPKFVKLLGSFVTLFAMLVMAPSVGAAAYPEKPIRMIVPWPAGGVTDVIARIVAERLGAALGQPVIVDNRGGASTIIGTEIVAKSSPDGYTLLWGTTNFATNPTMFTKQVTYDTVKDFTPIVLTVHLPHLMLVYPGMPVASLKDLIALAKSKPGQISYGSPGNGSLQHLEMEMIKSITGIDMVHVPYKGEAPAIIDLLAGRVSPCFISLPPVMGHIKSGKLRPIVVSTAKRVSALPDIPTIAESGIPGFASFDTAGFNFLAAPAGTPPEIVSRLNKEINTILKVAAVRSRFVELGAEPGGGTPEELGRYIQTQILNLGKIIKESGAKAD
jgi:tripartite-type tricarboxylate transporter receptor subunit TctC